MRLSYLDLLGDQKRHTINATITTDHAASSYGQPVIIMEDGSLLDMASFVLLGYQVVEATAEEIDLLKKIYAMIALAVDPHAAASSLGKRGGSATSKAKARAARLNGRRGGRPRKATH